jgi:hypothetical protein
MPETFTIRSITERTKLVPGAGFADVEDVTYETHPHGLIGTVTVLKSQATPEKVNKLIAAEVDRKHGILGL